jgi:hypothetical protein
VVEPYGALMGALRTRTCSFDESQVKSAALLAPRGVEALTGGTRRLPRILEGQSETRSSPPWVLGGTSTWTKVAEH